MPEYNRQSGFTLIELAIILTIAGLLLGGFMALTRSLQAQKRYDVTLARMNSVLRVLDNFAQINGRLPCPADPSGAGMGVMRATCTTAASRDGVVPFHNLGITQQMATDGYGNPFTYIVSAVGSTPNNSAVHANCRTNYWINSGLTSRNPIKAAFCCGQVTALAPQLRILRDLTSMTDAVFTQTNPSPGLLTPWAADFGNVNTIAPVAPLAQLDYVAYAVISHGPNGERSYLWSSAARKVAVAAGNAELENANGDNVLVDWRELNPTAGQLVRVRNDLSGTQRYDDVVAWRTQAQIIRDAQNDTCNLP